MMISGQINFPTLFSYLLSAISRSIINPTSHFIFSENFIFCYTLSFVTFYKEPMRATDV